MTTADQPAEAGAAPADLGSSARPGRDLRRALVVPAAVLVMACVGVAVLLIVGAARAALGGEVGSVVAMFLMAVAVFAAAFAANAARRGGAR